MSLEIKCLNWFANGEVGESSSAMAFCACGVETKKISQPYDPADLNRCLKLVKAIPEIKSHFDRIAFLSSEWAAIIGAWDVLENSFVEEVGWDYKKANRAPKTFDLMQKLFNRKPQ